MDRNNLLIYLYFIEEFKINTNARNFQLGAVIIQKGKPIAFNSRKLTEAQIIYKVTERELLCIVEVLKEFRTILLGQRLRIYADNKDLKCNFLIPIEY